MSKEEFSELVLTLVLTQRGAVPKIEEFGDLEADVESIFLTQSAQRHSEKYAYSPECPGYLFGMLGDKAIFTPWHLADHLPDEHLLAKIISISDVVKLNDDNPICLSGSAAFLRKVPAISDLDFCEYLISADVSPDSFEEKFRIRPEFIPCVLSYGGTDIPYSAGWNASIEHAVSCNFDTSIKIDVVYEDADLEIAATNLVLPLLDENHAQNVRSWTYQEAVITKDTRPPRSLVSIRDLQGYVDWLQIEASEHCDTDPGKALKRAVSLAAVLSLEDLLNAAIELLNNDTYKKAMSGKRQAEVIRFLGKIGRSYDKEKIADPEVSLVAELHAEMTDLVQRILGHIRNMEQDIIDAYQ